MRRAEKKKKEEKRKKSLDFQIPKSTKMLTT